MTFKVGDAVTLTGSSWERDFGPGLFDRVFIIEGFEIFDEERKMGPLPYVEGGFDVGKVYIYNKGADDFSATLIEWADDTEKQEVEPSYYDFPQGIEVRHISAHLTSFGGQALQYVARATRLDGRNKGNPIEDLTKALDFIQWEIDRLRELE